jgi:hypothetical protein
LRQQVLVQHRFLEHATTRIYTGLLPHFSDFEPPVEEKRLFLLYSYTDRPHPVSCTRGTGVLFLE